MASLLSNLTDGTGVEFTAGVGVCVGIDIDADVDVD